MNIKGEMQESSIREIRQRLEKAVAADYNIIAMTEMIFPGPMPENLGKSNAAVAHPSAVACLSMALEHQDHWHLYLLTLAKPNYDNTNNALTQEILLLFESMEMDELVIVNASGNA